MSQSGDSTSIFSLECDSSNESDIGVNANAKSCFEPYQGEPLASTDASESSDEEQDEARILYYPRFRRSVLKRLSR